MIQGPKEDLPECRHPSRHEPGRALGVTLFLSSIRGVKGASEKETDPRGGGAPCLGAQSRRTGQAE